MQISKRERNMLLIMAAAIVGAGIYIVWPDSSATQVDISPQALAESKKSAEVLLTALDKFRLSPREIQTVKYSAEAWPKDPLAPEPPKPQGEVEKDKFQYTGYIGMGDKVLAVINGREYQVGEQLESGGFEVLSISPEAVEIQAQGRKDKVRVPYQDPSFFSQR